jgi:hypothetical protein
MSKFSNLRDIKGVYFDAATARYFQDTEGTIPVTEEGQLIASARTVEGEPTLLYYSANQRPLAVMTSAGHYVPEFDDE